MTNEQVLALNLEFMALPKILELELEFLFHNGVTSYTANQDECVIFSPPKQGFESRGLVS